jgi:GcrA cell cycle regulator
MPFDWTDDRIAALKADWERGVSASQIARSIGCGLSRNAVVGKAHRLGFVSGASPKVRERMAQLNAGARRQRQRSPKVHKAALAQVMQRRASFAREAVQTAPSRAYLATLADLTGCMCRYPIGDPKQLSSFRYCGAPKLGQGPYCAHHHALTTDAGSPAYHAAVAEEKRLAQAA